MILASVVSSPTPVARISSAPAVLTLPAKTESPGDLSAGSDSPVIGASLIQHDEHGFGGCEIFADCQRGDDGDRDGHFSRDALFQQRRDRVVENSPAADQSQPDACVDAPKLRKHAQVAVNRM
jgi:hypothetical protein